MPPNNCWSGVARATRPDSLLFLISNLLNYGFYEEGCLYSCRLDKAVDTRMSNLCRSKGAQKVDESPLEQFVFQRLVWGVTPHCNKAQETACAGAVIEPVLST
jgi:hypothetical protein